MEAPRNAKRIAAIAEVPPDRALHAGSGIRPELTLPAALAAVDRGDQGHVADLDEIVERLAASGEPTRDRANERKVALDHPSALATGVTGPPRLEGRHALNARYFPF
jgi:hypothetical protein